jgi:hypothetical protein
MIFHTMSRQADRYMPVTLAIRDKNTNERIQRLLIVFHHRQEQTDSLYPLRKSLSNVSTLPLEELL